MRNVLAFFCTGVVLAVGANSSYGNNNEGDTTKMITAMKAHTLTEEQKADGWKLLFDGRTTKGWHQYGGAPVGAAWKIADGALYLDNSRKEDGKIVGGGDIVTDKKLKNFHLKLEWKISPAGNSGIMFYVNEDTAAYKRPYETGPEMQVLDNNGHPDAKIQKHRAGDLYDLISCTKETVKPVGEWNLAEIKCVKGKLDFYLNGENVVSTMMWDDAWAKMVAASKFKQWPGFGTFKKGRICLQDHGDMVWYRNIVIKKL
ncbi:MAG: 3-keto-disaccharide hydrolase [Bacteroidota bacterium]